jgi:uncharacterized protein YndB with AHSA1/START domain
MTAVPSPIPAVRLVRVLPASPAEVYRAWTEATLFARWMCTPPMELLEVSTDPRVGGAYRIGLREPDGKEHVTRGEYLELVPGERIVLSWIYEGFYGDDTAPSQVTVTLRPADGGRRTEIEIVHERARDAHMRELIAAGWPSCMDAMEEMLA